jgi:peptide-methionine (S)-S-oxide reductase
MTLPLRLVAAAFFLSAIAVPISMALQGRAVFPNRAEQARVIPAPNPGDPGDPGDNVQRAQSSSDVAVLAGGCFWGVQGVYQRVKGVTGAVSGYAGGARHTANYDRVGEGTTGHAEAVQITFDPRQISYGRLLQIFFSVAHDPTQLNRQGPDFGTQYRSAIFPLNAEQASVAKAYIAQLNQAKVFPSTIATTIEPGHPFYPAEEYHQDYLTRYPNQPYIVINDLPKIDDLKRLFPELYRADPILVLSGR